MDSSDFLFFLNFEKTKQNKKCTQKHNLTCLQVFEHWSATWIFKVNFALRKIVSGDATQPTDASYALWKKAYYILFKNLAFFLLFLVTLIHGIKWLIYTNITSSKSTVSFDFLIFSKITFDFSTPWLNPNFTNLQFKKVSIPHLTRTMKLALSENIIAG